MTQLRGTLKLVGGEDARDGAVAIHRVSDEPELRVRVDTDSHVLLFDLTT